jgi:uncharacterized tellurite resistance protein B-like protein
MTRVDKIYERQHQMQIQLDTNERDLLVSILLEFVRTDLRVREVTVAGQILNRLLDLMPDETVDALLNRPAPSS